MGADAQQVIVDVPHRVLERATWAALDVLGPPSSPSASQAAHIRRVFFAALTSRLGSEAMCPDDGDPHTLDQDTRRLAESNAFGDLCTLTGSMGAFGPGRIDEILIAMLERDASARKRGGVVYTPPVLARGVVELALGPLLEAMGDDPQSVLALRVLDPSCGSGVFLIETIGVLAQALSLRSGESLSSAMTSVAEQCVLGIDIDPVSVEIARWWVSHASGLDQQVLQSKIVAEDALLGLPTSHVQCDVVLGNPPFLAQLKKNTVASRERVKQLRAAGLIGDHAYTDIAGVFLLRAVLGVRAGGRVGMIVPRSILSSQGSAWIRSRLSEEASLGDVWFVPEGAFEHASVHVCVPVLSKGDTRKDGDVRVRTGAYSEVVRARALVDPSIWSPLHADAMGVPDPELGEGKVVGDLAHASADFRDEYYALKGLIKDDLRSDLRLVTSGLIDLAKNAWGEKAARIHKRSWIAPALDGSRSLPDEVARWVDARARPKLLIATQTPTIEVLADPIGALLPVTPVVSVYPHDPEDLWRVGAAIASPVCTAVALRRVGGSALHPDAIKLSAKQVLELPIPDATEAWAQGARLFKQAHSERDDKLRFQMLGTFGERMNAAFGLSGRDSDELLKWWSARVSRSQTDERA